MRKLLFLAFAVCVLSVGAFAQKANYSGKWTLDASKSKLDERMRVDSITLTVSQTDKQISVESATKRQMPSGTSGEGLGGRGFGRGFGGSGDGTNVYPLDGKELKGEVDGPNGKMPVIYKGNLEADGSLKISNSRTFTGQMGEFTITMKETWKLSADGKTLTVERENSTPRGTQTSTLVFVKG